MSRKKYKSKKPFDKSQYPVSSINKNYLFTYKSLSIMTNKISAKMGNKCQSFGRIITRVAVMNFWTRELNSGRETYRDECGEKQYTLMGEQAAEQFGVMSDNGQSDIEKDIFDWATELIF